MVRMRSRNENVWAAGLAGSTTVAAAPVSPALEAVGALGAEGCPSVLPCGAAGACPGSVICTNVSRGAVAAAESAAMDLLRSLNWEISAQKTRSLASSIHHCQDLNDQT